MVKRANGIYERWGKHGDVTYYIRYQFKTGDAEGRGIVKDLKEKVGRKSRGFTREMAKEALKARLGEVAQGKFSLERVREPIPFSQLVKRSRQYAQANWQAYEDNKGFIKYAENEFGDLPLSELTSWRIEQWKSKLKQNHKPGTVNVYITVLKSILSRGVEWGLLKSNPARSVKVIKLGDQRARYLTMDEMNRLLEACKESRYPWLQSYVILALNTGLRRSEMLGLSRSQNIDMGRGIIVVRQRKTQKVKSIPLNDSARKAIEELPVIDDRLFPISYGALSTAFKEALVHGGIKDFRVHDLRHSFASHLLMAGSDLATVSRLMGHANIAMTMRYAHLSPRHEAEAVAKLDAKLAQNRNISQSEEREVVEISKKQAASGISVT